MNTLKLILVRLIDMALAVVDWIETFNHRCAFSHKWRWIEGSFACTRTVICPRCGKRKSFAG